MHTAVPSTPPPVPTRLSARAKDAFTVVLSWEGDPTQASGVELEVTTETSSGSAARRAAILNPDTRSFEHVGRRPGTAYGYRVRAFNPAGPSDWTARAEVQVPKLRPAALGVSLAPCVPAPPEAERVDLRDAPNEVMATSTVDSGLMRWKVLGRARGCLRTLGRLDAQADVGALHGFDDEPFPLLFAIAGAGVEGVQFAYYRFTGVRYQHVHDVTLCGEDSVLAGPQLRFGFYDETEDPRSFQPPFRECQGAPDLVPR